MKIHPSADAVIFTFGKYKGYTISHVAKLNPSYLEWMSTKDGFNVMWKNAAMLVLSGQDISHLPLPQKKTTTTVGNVEIKTQIYVSKVNNKLAAIDMPYDPALIARFKFEVDGRKWNDKTKQWEFPLVQLPQVYKVFGDMLKTSPEIDKVYKKLIAEKEKRHSLRLKEDTEFEVPGLKMDLFPYQKVGVEFAELTNGRCLIADAPGLGKTVISISYASLGSKKTLIVCPLSVVINWKKEIKKFLGKDATIWTTKEIDGPLKNQFHIINYDAVRKVYDKLSKQDFDLLICDEATFLKNRNTLRFKSLLGSYKERRKFPGIKTDHVLFLTGTPVMSRPVEAFTLLNFLDKQRFNNFYHFTQRYGGWKGEKTKNLDELHERTKDLMIRRKKEEVLSELPPKQRNDLYIELSEDDRKEYERLLKDLFISWKSGGKPTVSTMPKIQSFLIERKIPRLQEMIQEYIDNDRPVLIFCCYVDPLKKLHEHYGSISSLIHGSMNKKDRQSSIDDLSTGKTKIGLFSLKAAGMGIDGLQNEIDTVIFLDMDWVPANHEQAEDRTHRIGQSNKVQAFYMICDGTIDEYMRDILREKQKIADQIVDGNIITPENNKSIFNEFIKKLTASYHFL